VGDASDVVFHGEGGFENVAMATADEGYVFALGVVEGDAEDFKGVPGAFEDGADEGILKPAPTPCFDLILLTPVCAGRSPPAKPSG
jgi:hypothetical protein